MATQTDGVLVQDWSNFAQQMLGLYAANKLVSPNSVVPKDDTAVIAPTQAPSTTGLGINLKSPLFLAGVAGVALLAFFALRKKR